MADSTQKYYRVEVIETVDIRKTYIVEAENDDIAIDKAMIGDTVTSWGDPQPVGVGMRALWEGPYLYGPTPTLTRDEKNRALIALGNAQFEDPVLLKCGPLTGTIQEDLNRISRWPEGEV